MARGDGTLGSKDRELLLDAEDVVGVDEVGRGALAGVCAAAFRSIPDDDGVHDSKLLTATRRDQVASRLRGSGSSWVICEVWPGLIDRINILEATRLAMAAAARSLTSPSSIVVTDHVNPGEVGCKVVSPARADCEYFCVAAASILAKVHRDRLMVDLGQKDPRWQWQNNKGYGTVEHRRALEMLGPGIIHRQSFGWSPVLP
jgi:ribonuclease HII